MSNTFLPTRDACDAIITQQEFYQRYSSSPLPDDDSFLTQIIEKNTKYAYVLGLRLLDACDDWERHELQCQLVDLVRNISQWLTEKQPDVWGAFLTWMKDDNFSFYRNFDVAIKCLEAIAKTSPEEAPRPFQGSALQFGETRFRFASSADMSTFLERSMDQVSAIKKADTDAATAQKKLETDAATEQKKLETEAATAQKELETEAAKEQALQQTKQKKLETEAAKEQAAEKTKQVQMETATAQKQMDHEYRMAQLQLKYKYSAPASPTHETQSPRAPATTACRKRSNESESTPKVQSKRPRAVTEFTRPPRPSPQLSSQSQISQLFGPPPGQFGWQDIAKIYWATFPTGEEVAKVLQHGCRHGFTRRVGTSTTARKYSTAYYRCDCNKNKNGLPYCAQLRVAYDTTAPLENGMHCFFIQAPFKKETHRYHLADDGTQGPEVTAKDVLAQPRVLF